MSVDVVMKKIHIEFRIQCCGRSNIENNMLNEKINMDFTTSFTCRYELRLAVTDRYSHRFLRVRHGFRPRQAP